MRSTMFSSTSIRTSTAPSRNSSTNFLASGTPNIGCPRPSGLPKKNADLFSMLRDMHLATGRAWSIKELLRDLWRCARRDDGLRLFKRWYAWAVRSRLAPVKVAAKTVKRHLWGILNWFEHRISNGMSEGINGLIEKVKVAARGYRNTENFKTVIYFHFGGLDLYPQTHGNPG